MSNDVVNLSCTCFKFSKRVAFDTQGVGAVQNDHTLSLGYRSTYDPLTHIFYIDCTLNEFNVNHGYKWEEPEGWKFDYPNGDFMAPRKLLTVSSVYHAMQEVTKSIDEVKSMLVAQGYKQIWPAP